MSVWTWARMSKCCVGSVAHPFLDRIIRMNGQVETDPIHVDWQQIDQYVNGVLPTWNRTLVESHISGCPGCRYNLSIKIRSLPFQPLTLDGEPRLPGMTRQSLRCGWSRLIGPYLACRMGAVERQRMENHLMKCEGCGSHMAIYIQSMKPAKSISLFHRVRQFLAKRGLFRRCFRKRGREGESSFSGLAPSFNSSLPSGDSIDLQ